MGNELVLFVDDEEVIRDFGRLILESFGYQVVTAPTAEEALVLAEQNATTLVLLITDVSMPGMDGVQLARLLLERLPRLKVLFVSGQGDECDLVDSFGFSAVRFLQKPYQINVLAEKVRETIDGTPLERSEIMR